MMASHQNQRAKVRAEAVPLRRVWQRYRRLALLAAGGLAFVACGDGSPSQSSEIPDALGTFIGEWRLTQITFSPEDTTLTKTCAGSVTIDDQPDNFFSGTFTVVADSAADCVEFVGSTVGQVFSNGGLQIVLLNSDELEVFTGCPAEIFGNAFGGSLRNDNLFAVRDDIFGACPQGLTQMVVIFEGQR